ncbi:unnamed protein product [Coregonus sp. 'balchen']|nr:unnamed protein product [Coregonus sp. 'balchen']
MSELSDEARYFKDLSSSVDSEGSAPPPRLIQPAVTPPGYIAFRDVGEQSEGICFRDVTSPINELDGQSISSRDMPTKRSSSSEGLPCMIGLCREGSLESNENSDQAKRSCSCRTNKGHHAKGKDRHGSSSEMVQPGSPGNCGMRSPVGGPPNYAGPKASGCLMEDKMAWMRVHMELVDNHRLTQDMNATLEKARACRSELLSRLSVDGNGIPYHCDSKLKGDTGGKGGWM